MAQTRQSSLVKSIGKHFGKTRKENDELRIQNFALNHTIDSLADVVANYQATIDSLSAKVPEEPTSEFDLEISDSLVHMWYVTQNEVFSKSYDMDVEHFTSNVSDEVFAKRLADINSFMPLPFNSVVKNYCILYSEKMREKMGRVIGLSEYYWPMIDEIFTAHGLPLELKALVIVESMLNPTATSRAGAKGLWQFMYGTARGYGLRIDSWIDERMDPVRSTEAAARYLKNAYQIYGDWALALASYNCGAGNINKAMHRSGGSRDFWKIYDYLPRETRGYVPAFTGALYAMHYYKEYGIVPKANVLTVPIDTFIVRKNLHFEQIKDVVGIPTETIAEMNPQYLHQMLPGSDHPCVLRIPMEFSDKFIDRQDSLYRHRSDSLLNPVEIKKISSTVASDGSNRIVYKVKNGDVLGKIASRYGVSVAQIKKWNNMSSDRIRAGQNLIIYRRR